MNGPTTMLAGPPHRRTQGLGALESGGAFNLCLFQRTCDPRELTIRKFFEITHPPARADERTRRALELYLCLQMMKRRPDADWQRLDLLTRARDLLADFHHHQGSGHGRELDKSRTRTGVNPMTGVLPHGPA